MSATTCVGLLMAGVTLAVAGAYAAADTLASPASPPRRVAELRVPMRADRITIDGESDDLGWPKRAGRTGPFRSADRRIARPYSEARFAWGEDKLFVLLYAADEDVVAPVDRTDGPVSNDDSFRLSFMAPSGERRIDVSPLGVVSDALRRPDGTFDATWNSDALVAHDVDGTPNVAGDDDEEWILEMALPLAGLGFDDRAGGRMRVELERCDRVRDAGRRCVRWGGFLALSSCRGDDCPP